jgi:hypothetical protein
MTCSIFGALFVEQQLLFRFNMHSRLVILVTSLRLQRKSHVECPLLRQQLQALAEYRSLRLRV